MKLVVDASVAVKWSPAGPTHVNSMWIEPPRSSVR